MITYCTTCCYRKSNEPTKVPAINRYISGRITGIYSLSKVDGVEFRIFSGKFGLLKPTKKIYRYDEKLSLEKVPGMTQLLCDQIKKEKITGIRLFVNSKRSKAWDPYITCITKAGKRSGIKVVLRYI